METFALIMVGLIIFCLIWCVAGLVQLHLFSNRMSKEINNTYENCINGNRIPWPDVGASYENLKWYKVWDYRFSKMIVFDKE